MAIETTCPGCKRPVRLPADSIGKMARCPACATVWTVEAPPPPAVQPFSDERHETSVSAAPAQPAVEHIREQSAGPIASSPTRPRPFDDRHEFQRDLDARRKRLQTEAKERLAGPAIAMFVVSGLLFAAALLEIVLRVVYLYQSTRSEFATGAYTLHVVLMFYCVWLVAAAIVTLRGALRIRKLENYSLSMAACIVAMIPNLEMCFLVGLPLGIWGLVTLLDPDVRSAFRRPAIENDRGDAHEVH